MLIDPLSFIAIIPDRLLWKANEMVAVSLSIFTVEGENAARWLWQWTALFRAAL